MTDLNKLRSEFEELPLIKEKLNAVYFDESLNSYFAAMINSSPTVKYVQGAWMAWQEKAKAQAVPEGYVLVTKDQAKDTARLDFMLQESRVVTTDINYDENYDKTGEGFCVNAVYWISGWDRLTETVHQTKREAIDEAINVASESGAEG